MATTKEWQQYFVTLQDYNLRDIIKAIDELMSYDMIEKEFAWCGFPVLKSLAEREQHIRSFKNQNNLDVYLGGSK